MTDFTECRDRLMQDQSGHFGMEILLLVKNEIWKCGDPNKLMLSSEVFCALLQASDKQVVKKALIQLAIFLCHRFPR